ncbi:AAA family ATPase [Xenorhabdus szentirmaii]|uniref:Plasmid stability protein n=1 Tax=Xenorhabdus szentirmaii DSM 16338 TaxID=1427518 RepID=W1IRB6_9GAMM|nr:AAA family ATPase [Xenorhabdus szentirmaii]PHM30621.1 plasmid stability protein [Xenorhabdus szentirmaii DSM 16338]CDL80959.1 putative plasmid stability protein [Xenorhabdus szentirmaii DSM 16338]
MSKNAKIILVGGSKGGPGKSTIAQQIAGFMLVKVGKKVHLLDIDIQKTTYQWCQDRESTPAGEDIKKLSYHYRSDNVIKYLNGIKDQYDYIVVDAGGFDSEVQREAMLCATHLLLPIRPKRRDVRSLAALDRIVEKAQILNEELKVRVVMNQCPSLPNQFSRIQFSKDVCETFGMSALSTNIYARNVYDDAEEAGRTIFELPKTERDKKAEKEIELLVKEFVYGEKVDG